MTININVIFPLAAVIIFDDSTESWDFEKPKTFLFSFLFIRKNFCRGLLFATRWNLLPTFPPLWSRTAMTCAFQQTRVRDFLPPYEI